MSKIESPSSVLISPGGDDMGRNTSSIPLKNYIEIRSQKPGNTLLIVGIVLCLVVPSILLFIVEDTLDLIPFCCMFILIGSILMAIGASSHSKWDKQVKIARERIESEENIPYPPIPQWPSIAASICLVGGFILSDLEGIFFLFGGIAGLIFLAVQAYLTHNRNQAYDAFINDMV